MIPSTLLSVILVGSLASAAVIRNALPRRHLTEHDIILWGGNGRVEVMNKSSYALLASQFDAPRFNLNATRPKSFNASTIHNFTRRHDHSPKRLSARCESETILVLDPPNRFLNWDVPMSSILLADGVTTTVAVTEGYQIANALAIQEQLTVSVPDILSQMLGITFTETWTSTYSAAYTFIIPVGKYGAVVSNPATSRYTGHVDVGCIGDAQSYDFQADIYSSRAYNGLSWVAGTISLCTGDTYPLPRCLGEGTLS